MAFSASLADPLTHDMHTLATINSMTRSHPDAARRVVGYMLIAPRTRDRIGEIAQQVFAENYANPGRIRTSLGALGRLVSADAAPANGELLSYLFFAPEFTDALIAEGASDARAWLHQHHDHGRWQHGPLDTTQPREGYDNASRQTAATTGRAIVSSSELEEQ